MAHIIALDYMMKETIDDYASIESLVFGDFLLKAMGIYGGCTLFRKSKKYDDGYILGWWLDDGSECTQLFIYEQIMVHLKGKTLKLTMDITID